MAKKKANQQEKRREQEQQVTVMVEGFEKLKSLNSMLLKETMEKRQQVESLVQAKASLESQLTRSNSEKCDLQADLDRLTEQLVLFEIENKLGSLFVAEKESDVECLRKKLIEMEAELEEANGLRVKLAESEKRGEETEAKLRIECNALLEEVNKIQSTLRDKEQDRLDSNKVIQQLNAQIVSERQGFEVERNAQVNKSSELNSKVTGLSDMVQRLQSEEAKLRQNLADLERRCLQGLRKEEEMDEKINELIRVNSEKESRVESLIEAKATVDKELNKALKQLDEERKMFAQTVTEKKEIEDSKCERETEIVELQKQLAEFKDTISELEVAQNAQEEKMKNLESEVGRYKAAFDQVVLDKDELQRCFDNEKQIGINMKKEIDGMEKHIQDLVKEVEQTKADYHNVVEENKDLETSCHVLNKEIANVQASLGEAQREIGSMQCKIELANGSSEEILNALKIAADSICSNDEKQLNGEYFKPHEADLEAIKNALKSKENKVEEMKRQVDFLQLSVAQAQKKTTFWTMLSSATTVIAAVSMAYAARGGN